MENYGYKSEQDDESQPKFHNRLNDPLPAKYIQRPWRQRYRNAIEQSFLPFRRSKVSKGTQPLNEIGWVNYLTVDWINKAMWKATRFGLDVPDLFTMDQPEDAANNAKRMQRLWDQEVSRCKEVNALNPDKPPITPSLGRVAWQFGKTRFYVSMILVVLSMFFQFAGPSLILQYLLEYLADPTQTYDIGILILVMLFLCQLFRNITFNMQQSIGIHTAIRMLSGVQYLGYEKLLRLSAPNDAALGQMLTFITADHERIHEAVVNGVLFVGTPFMFLMSIVYSIWLVGSPALVGSFAVFLFYPIMGVMGYFTSVLRERVVSITDTRVTMMNEVLNAMRLIKMYAWEEPFTDRIVELRHRELNQQKKSNFLQSVAAVISPTITIVAGYLTFLTMTLAGYDLYTSEAFTILSIFNSMQFSVGTLPYSLKCITEARVGFIRLQKVLELREFQSHPSNEQDRETRRNAITMEGASFSWEANEKSRGRAKKEDKIKEKEEEKEELHKNEETKKKSDAEKKEGSGAPESKRVPCLYDITLSAGRGQLVGVAGSVGSGKSSLISSIMAETYLEGGHVTVNGSLALVSQQAWIFNGTLRDNILMGGELKQEWYNTVIQACAMDSDIKMLSDGDMTIIGERGVTLSGGQRQRVNLARALYADLDIYLLDDPLSAVDARVAEHIFSHYIQRMLKNKTVILVTHGFQFLKQCDRVLFLKGGKLVEQGSHAQLMELPNGHYRQIAEFDAHRNDEQQLKKKKKGVGGAGGDHSPEEASGAPTTEEESTKDGGWGVLLRYFEACGGYWIMFLILVAIILFCLARLATSIWLQEWMDQGDGLEAERRYNMTEYNITYASPKQIKGIINNNPQLWLNQLVYAILIIIMLFFGVVKGIGMAICLMQGAQTLHNNAVFAVMKSPMAFFDATPVGRIINRFSKDLDDIDVRVPLYTEMVFQYFIMLMTQVILVCVLFPYFIIGFAIILVFFVLLDFAMNQGVLETKKLDNKLKSPVIHHITSSMTGVNVIRAFHKGDEFKRRFNTFLNSHMAADSLFRLSTRWFMWRMESLALLTIMVSGIVIVATKGQYSPAVAGLALSNLFLTCTMVPFIMKLKAEYRARINSIERVAQYQDLTQEAPHIIPENRPHESWPQAGKIGMREVAFRYRPELPLVLKHITVDISGGERVGIVGRTGAGKSSLISTLLRLVELDSGDIFIDDINIGKLGLADLRSAVAVIPQDPVLFQGTVRYNLDPFNIYSDLQVWEALEAANLKEKVVAEEKKLDMLVEAEGENFSVGEKQLICLARALLRRNKILLLDEATASVDMRTDHMIQSTIRGAFASCTVLTIAHRLNTVMEYDKILVLDQGRLAEFGPPALLLESNGIFASMAQAAGITEAHHQ